MVQSLPVTRVDVALQMFQEIKKEFHWGKHTLYICDPELLLLILFFFFYKFSIVDEMMD